MTDANKAETCDINGGTLQMATPIYNTNGGYTTYSCAVCPQGRLVISKWFCQINVRLSVMLKATYSECDTFLYFILLFQLLESGTYDSHV